MAGPMSLEKARSTACSAPAVRACVVAVLGLLLVGCDPVSHITFENRTGSTILAHAAVPGLSLAFAEVEAGQVRSPGYITKDRYEIILATEEREVFFRQVFTEEELEAIGFLFVIDEDGVHPGGAAEPALTPARTPE